MNTQLMILGFNESHMDDFHYQEMLQSVYDLSYETPFHGVAFTELEETLSIKTLSGDTLTLHHYDQKDALIERVLVCDMTETAIITDDLLDYLRNKKTFLANFSLAPKRYQGSIIRNRDLGVIREFPLIPRHGSCNDEFFTMTRTLGQPVFNRRLNDINVSKKKISKSSSLKPVSLSVASSLDDFLVYLRFAASAKYNSHKVLVSSQVVYDIICRHVPEASLRQHDILVFKNGMTFDEILEGAHFLSLTKDYSYHTDYGVITPLSVAATAKGIRLNCPAESVVTSKDNARKALDATNRTDRKSQYDWQVKFLSASRFMSEFVRLSNRG